MTYKLSYKDKKDWENFLENSDKIEIKDEDYDEKFNMNIEKSIDLHGYTLEQANTAIEQFILKGFEERVNKLIVVTGKGIHSDVEKNPYVSKDLSILKYSVPEFINNNQNLMRLINDIQDATIDDGGSGAFYVFLKKNRSKE